MPSRRTLMLNTLRGFGAISFLAASGAGLARAQQASQAELSLDLEKELKSILQQAQRTIPNAPSPASPDSVHTGNDLIETLLNLLDNSLETSKTGDPNSLDLAERIGSVLSQISRGRRDALGGEIAPARAPTFEEVRGEYKELFTTCVITDRHKNEINAAVTRINSAEYKRRYKDVESDTEVPWYVVGAIHYREASLNFMGHLHNGDFLKRKTVDVPAGRPEGAWPPEPWDPERAWRLSANDALKQYRGQDWSLERMLFTFERFNGWGYRNHPGFRSPYLWNYTQYYSRGGFPRDRVWSDSYVSKHAGLAAILNAVSKFPPAQVTIRYAA